MAKDTWVIQREQLREWQELLLKEPYIKDDGIHTVIQQIDDIVNQMDEAPVTEGLTFDDIKVGEVYKLRAQPGTKKYLHNIPVKIIDKKIKNVTGLLEKGAGNYKKGSRFTIPPSALERL